MRHDARSEQRTGHPVPARGSRSRRPPEARSPPSDVCTWPRRVTRGWVEEIPAVTFMASLDGGLNEVSARQIRATRVAQEEWMSSPALVPAASSDESSSGTGVPRALPARWPFRAECRFHRPATACVVWVHAEARLSATSRAAVLCRGSLDIPRASGRESIKASLRERDPPQEIHHRVKNNLQITRALAPAGGSASRPRGKAVRQSQRPDPNPMALVHEMLYRRNDLADRLREYARSLVQQLFSLVRRDHAAGQARHRGRHACSGSMKQCLRLIHARALRQLAQARVSLESHRRIRVRMAPMSAAARSASGMTAGHSG